MPTYVYKCNECDYTFEARQSFGDEPLVDCPQCENEALRRVINNVGVVFKGSGFYVTDSRNGKNGTSHSNGTAKSSEKPKTETSETPKAESPAEKN